MEDYVPTAGAGIFLSTLPARGATINIKAPQRVQIISIHAPREGSDSKTPTSASITSYFYPRSPRGERPAPGITRDSSAFISIHAPREGSDVHLIMFMTYPVMISIHAPREGSDVMDNGDPAEPGEFLSTLPARGATNQYMETITSFTDFYPRSPRGERPITFHGINFYVRFLSTLPARGATTVTLTGPIDSGIFLSTLPARGATSAPPPPPPVLKISIHAPREGSDS